MKSLCWVEFDQQDWNKQKLPKERKRVLLLIKQESCRSLIVVGYLRYAGGCKGSPYFVTPGADLKDEDAEVIAWLDGLVDEFDDKFILDTYNKFEI